MKCLKYFYIILNFLFFFILPVKSDSMFDIGKEIFLNQGNCAACHILADAGSVGQIGPNLDQLKPNLLRVINAVTNGIGVMPAYEGQLSDEEIKSVAHYVSVSTNQ